MGEELVEKVNHNNWPDVSLLCLSKYCYVSKPGFLFISSSRIGIRVSLSLFKDFFYRIMRTT